MDGRKQYSMNYYTGMQTSLDICWKVKGGHLSVSCVVFDDYSASV